MVYKITYRASEKEFPRDFEVVIEAHDAVQGVIDFREMMDRYSYPDLRIISIDIMSEE